MTNIRTMIADGHARALDGLGEVELFVRRFDVFIAGACARKVAAQRREGVERA